MALTRPRAYQIYDIDYKQATRVVTTTNITLAGGAPNTVDGVTLAANDRILVTAQSTGSENGIYYVTTLGTGSNGTWARSIDTNSTGELLSGTIVMVTEGTVFKDTQWKLTTDDPITIGSTALTFVQNYSANSISAGTSNVVVTSNGAVTISSAGTANVLTVNSTSANVSGNLAASGNISGNYFLGAGAETYVQGNTLIRLSVSGEEFDFTADTFNVNYANITSSGNISGNYILGNGSQLTGITTSPSGSNTEVQFNNNGDFGASSNFTFDTTYNSGAGLLTVGYGQGGSVISDDITACVSVTAYGPVTASGNLTSYSGLDISGNGTISGNITSAYFLGNANVQYTASATQPTGNLIGAQWYNTSNDVLYEWQTDGTSSYWVDITGPVIGSNGAASGTTLTNGTSNISVALNGNANVNITSTPNVVVWATTGEYVTGVVSATGNITSAANISGGNLILSGIATTTGNITSAANISGGNISTAGQASVTGNLTTASAVNFNLPNSSSTDVTISSGLATAFKTRIGTTADNQYSWRTNLYYTGAAWLKDDATRGAWRLNQVCLTGNANSVMQFTYAPIGSTNVNELMTLTGEGLLTVSGNISGGNLTTGAQIVATGNVTGGNLTTSGSVYVGTRGQIYDDGNFHIHSNSSGDAMWLNTNGAQINLIAQGAGGGSVGTGIGIGTSSLTGFVTIQGVKSWTTASSYGYLVNNATYAGRYTGGSQTISDVSLYANGRLMGIEIDALSDERAKNIQGNIPLDDALTFVKEVNGILYTWNRDAIEGNDTGLKSGFSAQRVHKAGFGHMISMMPNDRLAETTDEDGWTSPDKTQLAMNYSQAIPYHHEVIKHLLDRIEQLEATVAKLTNK